MHRGDEGRCADEASAKPQEMPMGQGQKAAAAWSSRSVACGAMARTMAMCGSPGRLTGEVERDGGDDDLRQRPERPPEPRRAPAGHQARAAQAGCEGGFTTSDFTVDENAGTVTCPAAVTRPITARRASGARPSKTAAPFTCTSTTRCCAAPG